MKLINIIFPFCFLLIVSCGDNKSKKDLNNSNKKNPTENLGEQNSSNNNNSSNNTGGDQGKQNKGNNNQNPITKTQEQNKFHKVLNFTHYEIDAVYKIERGIYFNYDSSKPISDKNSKTNLISEYPSIIEKKKYKCFSKQDLESILLKLKNAISKLVDSSKKEKLISLKNHYDMLKIKLDEVAFKKYTPNRKEKGIYNYTKKHIEDVLIYIKNQLKLLGEDIKNIKNKEKIVIEFDQIDTEGRIPNIAGSGTKWSESMVIFSETEKAEKAKIITQSIFSSKDNYTEKSEVKIKYKNKTNIFKFKYGEKNKAEFEKFITEKLRFSKNNTSKGDLEKLFDNSKPYLKKENYNIINKPTKKQKGKYVIEKKEYAIYDLKTEYDTKNKEGFVYTNNIDISELKNMKQSIIKSVKYSQADKNKNIKILYSGKNGEIKEGYAKDVIIFPNLEKGYKEWDWNEYRCKKPHCNMLEDDSSEEDNIKINPNCCAKTNHSNGVHYHNLRRFLIPSIKIYFISKGMEHILNINESDILAGIRRKVGIREKNIIVITAGTERILQLCEVANKKGIKYLAFIHSTC